MTNRLGEALDAFPLRPASEVEWEELLYRVELMMRAVRVQLEEADLAEPSVARIVDAMVQREQLVQALVERATGGEEPGGGDPLRRAAQDIEIAEDTVDRFVRLRARTFAMAQRRGIDIWDRSAPLPGGGSATVHQIFAFLASGDASSLAALRAALGRTPVC